MVTTVSSTTKLRLHELASNNTSQNKVSNSYNTFVPVWEINNIIHAISQIDENSVKHNLEEENFSKIKIFLPLVLLLHTCT